MDQKSLSEDKSEHVWKEEKKSCMPNHSKINGGKKPCKKRTYKCQVLEAGWTQRDPEKEKTIWIYSKVKDRGGKKNLDELDYGQIIEDFIDIRAIKCLDFRFFSKCFGK